MTIELHLQQINIKTNKAKVKLSLCLQIKHHAMKAYARVDVYTHVFLTSALVGGEWSASLSSHFTPGERAPRTQWIGGWVGRRIGLEVLEKRKILDPIGTRTLTAPLSSLKSVATPTPIKTNKGIRGNIFGKQRTQFLTTIPRCFS
jgi:hypothetical protein